MAFILVPLPKPVMAVLTALRLPTGIGATVPMTGVLAFPLASKRLAIPGERI
jgi:hypothetical protein